MARKRDAKASGPARPEGAGDGSPPSKPASSAAAKAGQGLSSVRSPAIGGRPSGRGLGKQPPVSAAVRSGSSRARQQVIPDAVANRMARRIAIATGIPTLMGMGVFIASYLVVSRGLLDIPPVATLLASGACFLLGLVGLSYGVLSSSWEDKAGTLLGFEQIGLNISRVRTSIRAMRQGGAGGPMA